MGFRVACALVTATFILFALLRNLTRGGLEFGRGGWWLMVEC